MRFLDGREQMVFVGEHDLQRALRKPFPHDLYLGTTFIWARPQLIKLPEHWVAHRGSHMTKHGCRIELMPHNWLVVCP